MGTVILLILLGLGAWYLARKFLPKPNGHDEELTQLHALHARVSATGTKTVEVAEQYVAEFFKALELEFSEQMRTALRKLVWSEELPRRIDIDGLNFKERIDLRRQLIAWEMKNKDEGEIINDFLMPTFVHLGQRLPKLGHTSPFSVSMIESMTDPQGWITELWFWLCDRENIDMNLFEELRSQMYRNLCYHSNVDPDAVLTGNVKWKHANESGLPYGQLADVYLRNTPFYDLLTSPIPLRFSQEDRFSHTHIVGGTGAGKTTLLESLILHDIKARPSPSLVVIDPHSDLIRKLTRTDLGIEDRLILIDPRDVQNPPALNIFALNKERLAGYDEAQREQVVAGVIETYEFLFSGFGIDLTGKQAVLFRNVCRVMLSLPETMGRNATILDMMHIMKDPTPYQKAIDALPEIPREFFQRDFKENTFKQTKEEIRYRLQAVLENPTMARLFTSEESRLDLFTELNNGAIILVDTAEDFLKGASADYGRVFITLILQAILERSVVEEGKRTPTFIYIDEAASFFSQNVSKMLTDARKYKAGLVLSHQFLDQATPALRASLAANTASKFVSGLSAKDASAFAPDMRTTTDFILNQPKYHFAAYIRGVTTNAVTVPVAGGAFAQFSLHSADVLLRILEKNRSRVSFTAAERPAAHPRPAPDPRTLHPASAPPREPSPQAPYEDIARE